MPAPVPVVLAVAFLEAAGAAALPQAAGDSYGKALALSKRDRPGGNGGSLNGGTLTWPATAGARRRLSAASPVCPDAQRQKTT
jgi:hypothetical protein